MVTFTLNNKSKKPFKNIFLLLQVFIALRKVLLTLKLVDDTLICNHSNKKYESVFFYVIIESKLVCGRNSIVLPFK